MTSPTKTSASSSQYLLTPPRALSQLFLTSPTSKGKGESHVGYLMMVGPVEISRKGKPFYLVQLQVSKSECLTITVMQVPGNRRREDFMPYLDQVVLFESIYPGDSCFFFNSAKGSKYKVCVRELPYALCDMASTVEQIKAQSSGKFNLKGLLKWVHDGASGQCRSAVVADATGHIEVTVWKNSWFSLTEESPILMTEMLVKEFFGVKLSTTHNSCFKKVEDIHPMWSDSVSECAVPECRGTRHKICQVGTFYQDKSLRENASRHAMSLISTM